jgi:hypothetical protein
LPGFEITFAGNKGVDQLSEEKLLKQIRNCHFVRVPHIYKGKRLSKSKTNKTKQLPPPPINPTSVNERN